MTNDAARHEHRSPLVELTLARLRLFVREPEALFWTFVFPILMSVAMAFAFPSGGAARILVGVPPGATTTPLGQTLSAEQRTAVYGRLFVHLNLNTATREQILLIPNAGQRMVREFQEYRPYKSLAVFHREIDKYVDDAELARLEQYVFVPIDLNTASDADIQTIPGIGARMLREFKEYRPYKAIDQFRREMGKYVDEKEVARMERYVAIN